MTFDIGHLLCSIVDACETAAVTARAKETQQPAIPPKFSRTERTLVHMMRENTGASILDSGGAYGRAWQRALIRDFGKVAPCTMSGRVSRWGGRVRLDLDVTIDLFTYLASRLEYDRALTGQFQKFAALPGNEDKHYLELMQRFPEWIADKRDVRHDGPWMGNSYNEDNYLSGTVQYTSFQLDGEDYVLFQIHGGCDVRGGYTPPKVFRCEDNGCGRFGDWYEAQIFPDRDEIREIADAMKGEIDRHGWLLDDVRADYAGEAATLGDDVWWSVGGNEDHGEGAAKNLDEYPVREIASRAEWQRGWVCVLEDGTVLCPETGATLRADFCK